MIIIRTKAKPVKEPSKLKCLQWKLEQYCQNIKDFFNPKNEWFYEDIPNHYMENDDLIKTVLFKTLVSYVEVEKGLTHFEWSEGNGPLYKEIIEDCYEAITKTIPETRKVLDEISIPHEDNWKLYVELEDKLKNVEQQVCEAIVKIRGVLWT